MAKNTGSNEEKMTTPSQNGQGHSDNSLVPTEVLVVPCNQHVEDQMQEPNKKKKKKKSRGDRKAQNKRRRLRRQLQKGNDNQNAMEPNVVGLHAYHNMNNRLK
jgi:ribonuclease HI